MVAINRLLFCYVVVLLSIEICAFESYDNHLRISSFENEISLVDVETDSVSFDYVYLGDTHFYTRVIFYINVNTRSELILWSDKSCVYRQFFQDKEIKLGKLEIDSNKYDSIEYSILDNQGDASTAYFKNFTFRRTGIWKESEVLNGLIINETKHYDKGLMHGVSIKEFNALILQESTFNQGVLVSDSVFFSTEISRADFYGLWRLTRLPDSQTHFFNNVNTSIYVLDKNVETRTNNTTMTFDSKSVSSLNESSICGKTKESRSETKGVWQLDAAQSMVSIPHLNAIWKIHFVSKDFIIFSESE